MLFPGSTAKPRALAAAIDDPEIQGRLAEIPDPRALEDAPGFLAEARPWAIQIMETSTQGWKSLWQICSMDGGASGFEAHPGRGRFNAAFFRVLDGYIDWHLRRQKKAVFTDLPDTVVEIGSGVGANFRYIRPGTTVIAVEPNPYMHRSLRLAAKRRGIELDIRDVVGERIDLPDASSDAVISSLVLCTVPNPGQVVSEVRRVLRPGGRYSFVEHVAAEEGTLTRRVQGIVRRPWAWVFEGCSCERDLQTVIRSAGFLSVEDHRYRIHSPFLPFNTQIAGTAEV